MSPILAANGVAKLSGFICNLLVKKITAINTKSAKKMILSTMEQKCWAKKLYLI